MESAQYSYQVFLLTTSSRNKLTITVFRSCIYCIIHCQLPFTLAFQRACDDFFAEVCLCIYYIISLILSSQGIS